VIVNKIEEVRKMMKEKEIKLKEIFLLIPGMRTPLPNFSLPRYALNNS
jgi:hypothetical protein